MENMNGIRSVLADGVVASISPFATITGVADSLGDIVLEAVEDAVVVSDALFVVVAEPVPDSEPVAVCEALSDADPVEVSDAV
jgi:hypothetical protein